MNRMSLEHMHIVSTAKAPRRDTSKPIRLAHTALVIVAMAMAAGCEAAPETMANAPIVVHGAQTSAPVVPRVFDAGVRALPTARPWTPGDPVREVPRRVYPRETGASSAAPAAPEPKNDRLPPASPPVGANAHAPESNFAPNPFTDPLINLDGIGFTGVRPPDTVGDVGPNHYIQMVNDPAGCQFEILDKTGTNLAGPTVLSTLWTASGGSATDPCANGHGDPIVLYDPLADRWLMSEFADVGNHLCVYVSQTPAPENGWFIYDFTTPDFPDYPKYAVWPDAYYVTSNESSPAAYALDRTQMLAGLPATSQRFTAPNLAGFPFQALTPGDLDGATAPPAGAPAYFARHRDDEVHNAPGTAGDFLDLFELHVDFVTPANSTFTGPISIPIAEFDSDLCGLVSFACFPQPGTGTTLDPLREVVMWRLQYRNFGTHESLVGNFVTDTNGADHGGIRWFELRKVGAGAWTLFQEGTYSPDADNRWMGSIAMDRDGNIALGYSVSSSTVFPSIRYTGRLASDPPGTMSQPETSIVAGAGSQSPSTRWGDYSAMSVDPADDCTFWYTNEYMPASGLWTTRIASFRVPSCGNQPPVAVCKDVTISADAMCLGTITPADVDGGSSDPDGDAITLAVAPPGPFGLGTTQVTLTVTDEHGASDSCTANVTVVDTTPPVISSVQATPSVLWPPNHKMVPVTVSATAADNCDTTPTCKIVSVSSNEPVLDPGSGNTSPDWEITGDLTAKLRAERSGPHQGRIYTLTVECKDDAGNSSSGQATVTVPHNP